MLNKIFSYIKTKKNLIINSNKKLRRLEIGPGEEKIKGFEALNISNRNNTDYVLDAFNTMPFPDNTFDLIYASHVLEHAIWYQNIKVLKEWIRILKPNGKIELWVPDGLKICKAFVKCEKNKTNKYVLNDGWYKYNKEKDPCVWVNGRIFTYGDGSGNINNPNWHHTLYSYRYLKKILNECGLIKIHKLKHKEIRGYDHKWINLGISATKSDI